MSNSNKKFHRRGAKGAEKRFFICRRDAGKLKSFSPFRAMHAILEELVITSFCSGASAAKNGR